MTIRKLRRELEPALLNRPGVTGVSNIGDTLRIYVEGTDRDFPTKIEGYNVEVFTTGKIKALNQSTQYHQPQAFSGVPWTVPGLALDPLRTQKYMPVPGGVSIGHPSITAGSHGVSLKFLRIPYGLSNNHVLAAGSTFEFPKASLGDVIIQPGSYDGGTLEDAVGTLYWYMPMSTSASNLIDAALWQPYTPEMMSDEILDIGVPQGVAKAKIGDMVQKSGRTSGLTMGEVIDIDATIRVGYGSFEADFHNQIITDVIGDPGDSGSAVLDTTGPNLVGLLFAGSDYVTVHNHIGNVLDAIGTTIPPGAVAGPLPIPFLVSYATLFLSLI